MKTREQINRAYSVLDYITAHPEQHNQDYWITLPPTGGIDIEQPVTAPDIADGCGTAACFAGWTVLLAGHTITEGANIIDGTGTRQPVARIARYLLGLTPDEAADLFLTADTLDDVREEIRRIYGPRPAHVDPCTIG